MSNSKKTVKGEFSNMYGDGKNLNVGKNKPVKELLNNIKNSNLNKNQIIENDIKNTNIKNTTNSTTPTKNEKNENEKVIQPNLIDKSLERKETLSLPPISMPTFSFQSPFKMVYIIIIIIILLTIGLVYFYRDMFVYFFDSIFGNGDKKEKSEIVKNSKDAANNSAYTSAKIEDTAEKIKVTSEKVDVTSAKINELDKKVDTLITTTNEKCSGKNCPAVTELNNKLNSVSKNNSPKESNVTEDGYCYIGYDNGQRECIQTYAGETCMSGEIFPSLDVCINPKVKSTPLR
jgi:hypothetical protein